MKPVLSQCAHSGAVVRLCVPADQIEVRVSLTAGTVLLNTKIPLTVVVLGGLSDDD